MHNKIEEFEDKKEMSACSVDINGDPFLHLEYKKSPAKMRDLLYKI
jgi:hypothetical protein